MHDLRELVRLFRLGTKASERARLLRMSRTTERHYRRSLRKAGLLDGTADDLPELATLVAAIEKIDGKPELPPQQRSAAEPWRDEIAALHLKQRCQAAAIYERLRRKHGDAFTASYDSVKRLCRRLRREQPFPADKVVIRVETAPAQVAQVDFGYLGKLHDTVRGVATRLYIFVMTLGYSRHSFVKLVKDQSLPTFLQCHTEAFEFFRGVPHTVVPDNLKSAVISAAFGLADDPILNQSYRALAAHYGFKIDPTPPYDPKKKGKVERDVGYVKRNFYAPISEELRTFAHAERELALWHRETASKRIHGTTREPPIERFERDEQGQLIELAERYEKREFRWAKVHRDAHVCFDKRFYSVPFEWIGRRLWLEATATTVIIHDPEYRRIATHRRTAPGRHSTVPAHLPPERRELRHRDLGYWFERGRVIAPTVESFLRFVAASDAVASKLRTVQAMMKLLDAVPPERAIAAAERAQHFGVTKARRLRSVIDNDLTHVAATQVTVHGALDSESAPTFARGADYFDRRRAS